MTRWQVITECESHGTQTSLIIVFDGQSADEIANCQPVCPECRHIDDDPAQAVVTEIQMLRPKPGPGLGEA